MNNPNTPITFTIIRHEQIDTSGVFGQRILVSIDCTLGDLDRLYSEYRGFLVQVPGVQVALFISDPVDTPITKHRARAQYSTLAPIPAPLELTEDSKGRLLIADDPPYYSDWNDLNPR